VIIVIFVIISIFSVCATLLVGMIGDWVGFGQDIYFLIVYVMAYYFASNGVEWILKRLSKKRGIK
jgi:hypothetical protein